MKLTRTEISALDAINKVLSYKDKEFNRRYALEMIKILMFCPCKEKK